MIHFVPLENIEERYTVLMNKIVNDSAMVKTYYPEWQPTPIVKGEFLDIERTVEFKAKQIQMISQAFQNGEIQDGDWFFFADIFFPGIESVKYMSELQDIKIKVSAFNHAGRADRYDFIQKLRPWSDAVELGYHELCDLIFVGSNFHKNNVTKYFDLNPEKVIATGCIWNNDQAFKTYPKLDQKKDYVIFPHRLSQEKGILDFFDIATSMPTKNFIITSSSQKDCNLDLPSNVTYVNKLSKKEYYMYLSSAKYYLSTAYQETFGYTLREALLYNCRIVVPNDLCYPEMLPSFCLYERGDINTIQSYLTDDYDVPNMYKNMYNDTFTTMINHLK